ncbi:TIGR03089 family protein [Kytococcus sp. Marseille-QA3725]
MTTPATVLEQFTTQDPQSPRLTCFDDVRGERIELSGAVLANWTAKAANVLQEEFDVEPGSVVVVDLPRGHWRTAYWVLATWAVGAVVALDPHEGADVLVTTRPSSDLADDSDEVVAVTLHALARGWEGEELPTGVFDDAAELASFGDGFTPWHEVEDDHVALVLGGERWTMAEVAETVEAGRVLVHPDDPVRHVRTLLGVWAAGGSVVTVVSEGPVDPDQPRFTAEGVTRSAT